MSEDKKVIRDLSRIGIYGNLLLTAFKLFAGIVGKSGAMVSDAVHSLSDVAATLISAIGALIAGRSADKEHPYGHDKFESIATVVLGVILAGTGIGIGVSSVKELMNGTGAGNLSLLPMIAAVVSIVCKYAMYRYTVRCAEKIGSTVFRADAYHHLSDALSSVGALIGIIAARLGFAAGDAIASFAICVCILKIAWDILRDSLGTLTDASCGKDFEKKLRECAERVEGVVRVDALMTRRFGSKAYADLEIAVDGTLPLTEAHEIAEEVHRSAETQFPSLKHIMIHVNPSEDDWDK